MKVKELKVVIMALTIVLMIGCVNQAEPVSSNLYITSLKDFSIILCNLKREQNITTLYFTITKMSEGEPDFILQIPKVKEEHERQLIKIPITLTDDHENRYNGKLQIDLGYKYGGESIINYFPKGFTYVGTAKIWMPKIAPIEKLKIGDKEIPFEKAKFTKPQFMENFGDFTGIKSQKIQVGKWLSFTIGEKITPAGGSWEIPLIIENEDYNPLSIQMIFGTQLYDGRICWYDSSGYRKNAKGLSKFSDEIQIVNAQYYGYTEEFVHPIACLVMGINESTKEASLRVFPVSPDEFSILVGQGTKEMQEIFLQAYNRNGGRKNMGDPLNLPHWFAGGDRPKDENDVLIQEFPAISDFGKSAIIWNRHVDTNKAGVLHGKILETYLNSGGPYGSLGNSISDEVAVHSYFETEGSYANFEQGIIVLHHEQIYTVEGKILEKWKEKNLAEGLLGFPIGNKQPVSSDAKGFKTTGWVQEFEGGHIYYITNGKNAGRVSGIHGPIDKKYQTMGASESWLGFPVADITKIIDRDHGDFEAGYIGTLNGSKYQAFSYGNRIVFSAIGKDRWDHIYVMNADGSNLIRLTTNVSDSYPAWSPDGKKIVFCKFFERGEKIVQEIYVMNADGSNQVRLTANNFDFFPNWSPDGKKITFYRTDGIYVMDADGSNQVRLPSYMDDESPAWSPDGKKIVFSGGEGGIYVMDADGSNKVRLNHFGCDPAWSPDGKKIVYWKGINGWSHIYVINADGSNIVKLTANDFDSHPGWSPDGKKIVFLRRNDGIYVMNTDGSDQTLLIRFSYIFKGGRKRPPQWWAPSTGSEILQ